MAARAGDGGVTLLVQVDRLSSYGSYRMLVCCRRVARTLVAGHQTDQFCCTCYLLLCWLLL